MQSVDKPVTMDNIERNKAKGETMERMATLEEINLIKYLAKARAAYKQIKGDK